LDRENINLFPTVYPENKPYLAEKEGPERIQQRKN